MTNNYLPGTNVPYSNNEDVTSNIKMMIDATNGLSLSQLCSITNLEPSTIQNWVKRGYLFKPINKKYYERHVARVLIIKSLRGSMLIEDISDMMHQLNGDLEDTSDDIIFDGKLYEYFALVVDSLDDYSFTNDNINSSIDGVLKNYNGKDEDRIKKALNIMTYAYISGLCKTIVDENFKELRKK